MALSLGNAQLAGISRTPFAASRVGTKLARRAQVVVRATAQPSNEANATSTAALAVTGLLAPLFLDSSAAQAIGREYGILEGQILSLTHPALMFFLFGSSLYAGYLGFQWRHTRELADQIKALKAQRQAAGVGADGQPVAAPPSALDGDIAGLEKVRVVCV